MPVKATVIYFPAESTPKLLFGHVGVLLTDDKAGEKCYISTMSFFGIFPQILWNQGSDCDTKECGTSNYLTVELPERDGSIHSLVDEWIKDRTIFYPRNYRLVTKSCAHMVAGILQKLGYYSDDSVAKKWFLLPSDIYLSACNLPGARQGAKLETESAMTYDRFLPTNYWSSRLSLLTTIAFIIATFALGFGASLILKSVAFAMLSAFAAIKGIHSWYESASRQESNQREVLFNSIPYLLMSLLAAAAFFAILFPSIGGGLFSNILSLWIAPLGFSLIISLFAAGIGFAFIKSLSYGGNMGTDSNPYLRYVVIPFLVFAVTNYLFFLPLNFDLGSAAVPSVIGFGFVGAVASLVFLLQAFLIYNHIPYRDTLFSDNTSDQHHIYSTSAGFRPAHTVVADPSESERRSLTLSVPGTDCLKKTH